MKNNPNPTKRERFFMLMTSKEKRKYFRRLEIQRLKETVRTGWSRLNKVNPRNENAKPQKVIKPLKLC